MLTVKWTLPTDEEAVLVLMSRLLNGVEKYRIPMKELKDNLVELMRMVYSIGCRDMMQIINEEDSDRTVKMSGAREVIRKELVDEIIAMLMDQEDQRLKRRNLNLPISTPSE